jgi:glycine reductase
MVKELEEVVDVPVVHVCTVVPISLTVGANRIDPAVAIPYPLGNPQLNQEEEFALRRSIVEKALQALTTDISEQTVF